ncbi:glycoside hydrolase family 3 protein [Fomitiporia mediterranea MF3/22]|uniref:glycoside hydrolase family 3 protein n=1 Tax=Fomitiporia mediterranea (strain MF3/22) TaxID=694068 RepID=UPI000440838D|nr:glycoside hydrolase family 3 protein [Fomitiporia mediterranea MF3/22]EJD00700.1 glycoside hydrolase family 3 protein [Fomitiporia mediterranea MF3/22]
MVPHSGLSFILGLLPLLLYTPASVYSLPDPGSAAAGDLPFHLHARAQNKNGSTPVYKDPTANIEDRVKDLLSRMTLQEKVAQIIQGDMNGWMDFSDPLDDTLTYNASGLVEMMSTKAGSVWGGYQTPWDKFVFGVEVGQRYLMENTTLGIPALIQSEGLHGFTNNGTTFPSPLGLAASFNPDLLSQVASSIADEAEGLGVSHIFAPVLDLSRELRWGRVEENYGEDPFLTGEMGTAYVTGLQSGRRRNVSDTAIARVAATCKHFAAFGSPQGGLNLAPVEGGERALRSIYLPPFEKACAEAGSLSIMTAYSSFDGVPVVSDAHILKDILRDEWNYPYWVTCDAGSIDLQITEHATCDTRECAAREALVNGVQGEMGGGSYTYLTLPDQVAAGTVKESDIDAVVVTMLRTKFALGLFENPYPYADYNRTLRTQGTREILHQMEQEAIVLLENHDNTLPLSTNGVSKVAVIGPQGNRVSFGDYVFFNASNNGISPLDGIKSFLANKSSSISVSFAQGCELWSSDTSGIPAAVDTATDADAAIIFVGTWSLDQTLLWTPGTNATTGEHVDLSYLGLVGAQRELVQSVVGAMEQRGKKSIVVFVSGKPLTEDWIQAHAGAVVQQFYPGELGGIAIAEVLFGEFNPSGKLPVSFPRATGTTPSFYNYLKGGRPIDPGNISDDGTLHFGHQYVLSSPVPLWSFGHGLSYTNFTYSNLRLSSSTIGTSDDFNVTVNVRNSGAVDGKEVVQVYLTDVVSSVVTPNQFLAGFQKVDLPAGSEKEVTITIKSEQLAVWTRDSKFSVEPGTFNIRVGTSDTSYGNVTLTVQ